MDNAPFQAPLVDASNRVTPGPWRDFFARLTAAATGAGSGSDAGVGISGLNADADSVGASIAEMMSFLPPAPPAIPPAGSVPPAMPFLPDLDLDARGDALAEVASFLLPAPPAVLAPPLPPAMPFVAEFERDARAEALDELASFLAPASVPDIGTLNATDTGTVNDYDFQNAAVVRLANASDLTITGLLAGRHGQEVTFYHTGAGLVFFTHQDTGSVAANRLSNTVTVGATPLGPSKGSATFRYDGSSARWRLVQHDQGAWISATFSAGEFTANGAMTWTVASGDVSTDRYLVIGPSLVWQFRYITTTVGGVINTQLLKTIPAGYQLSLGSDAIVAVNDAGVVGVGVLLNSTNTVVAFQKIPAANWTLSVDLTQVKGTVTLGIA